MPELAGVEHHWVDVGGLRLHYAAAGPADGEPVVLVHGWPQHWYAWRRVIPLLQDRFRVIAPDLRGFGWSDAPRSSYTKDEFGDDIANLLTALDLRGVRLAGHDWGGIAVFLAALQVPERLKSLTAFAITHPWATGRPGLQSIATALAYQPLIATPLLGAAVQRFTPFVDLVYRAQGGDRIWSAQERRAFRDRFREADRAEAASRVYRSFLLKELTGGFRSAEGATLQVPSRLVLGSRDAVVTEQLNAGAPPELEVVVADGGHWLPESRPETTAEHIARDA